MTHPDTLVIQGLRRCENRVNIQRSAKLVLKELDNQANACYPTRAFGTRLQRRINEDSCRAFDAQCDTVRCREFVRFFAYSRYFLCQADVPYCNACYNSHSQETVRTENLLTV